MRTFPPAFAAELARRDGAAPVWLLRFTAAAIDHLLCQDAITVTPWGMAALPWVSSWGKLNQGVTGRLDDFHISDLSITLLNDPDSSPDLRTITKAKQLNCIAMTVYLWFDGCPDPPQEWYQFRVRDVDLPDEATVAIEVQDESLMYEEYSPGRVLTRDEYPYADPDDVGKIIPPLVAGTLEKFRTLSVDAGAITSLVAGISATALSMTVSDASMIYLNMLATIDEETVRITAIAGTVLTIDRGVDATVAAVHNRGSAVAEIRPNAFVYQICDHPLNAINKVWSKVGGKMLDVSAIATVYTGQTGDEHPDFPGQACVTVPGFISISQAVNLLVNDGIGISDTLAVLDGISVLDGLTITDGKGVSHTLAVNDGKLWVDGIAVNDGLTITDGKGVSHTLAVSDGKTIVDGISVVDGKTLSNTLSVLDSIGVSDTIAVSDLIAISDAITVGDNIGVTDSIGVSDTIGISAASHAHGVGSTFAEVSTNALPHDVNPIGADNTYYYIYFPASSGTRTEVVYEISIDNVFMSHLSLSVENYGQVWSMDSVGSRSVNITVAMGSYTKTGNWAQLHIVGMNSQGQQCTVTGAKRTITISDASTNTSTTGDTKTGSASKTGTITKTGAASRGGSVTRTGSASKTGAASKTGSASLSGSVSLGGSVSKSGTVGTTGTIDLTGGVSLTGTVGRSGSITKTGTISSTGAITLDGGVTLTGSVSRSGSVAKSGTVTRSGAVAKTGTVSITGNSVANTLIGEAVYVDLVSDITAPSDVVAAIYGKPCQVVGQLPAGYSFNGAITVSRRAPEWSHDLARQCRCWFRFILGTPTLIVRPDALVSVKAISEIRLKSGRLAHSQKLTDLGDVINTINLLYDRDWSKDGNAADVYRRAYPDKVQASIDVYGVRQKPELFKFDFVTSPAMAASLTAFYLLWYAHQRWRHTFEGYIFEAALEFADVVNLAFLEGETGEVMEAGLNPGSGKNISTINLTVIE